MKCYKVMILGENFLSCAGGDVAEMMGFYTTCFVEAENEEIAEINALKFINQDPELNNSLAEEFINKNPMLYLEEMCEINPYEMQKNHGYIWFSMEDI